MTQSNECKPIPANDDELDGGAGYARRKRHAYAKLGEPASIIPNSLVYELDRLLNYLWDDEHEDYENSDFETSKSHIFRSLSVLRTWTDSRLHDIESFLAQASTLVPSVAPVLPAASEERPEVKRLVRVLEACVFVNLYMLLLLLVVLFSV